jgi:DNA modification methylase
MHKCAISNGRNKRCVWEIPLTHLKEAHYATFPLGLCDTPINAGCPKEVCRNCGIPKVPGCKCNAGFTPGIIIDPFMGSGTTAIAAQNMGRDYIGFELNPDYIKIAKKRIEKASQ